MLRANGHTKCGRYLLASSLAAAWLDGFFEHPAQCFLLYKMCWPLNFQRATIVFPLPCRGLGKAGNNSSRITYGRFSSRVVGFHERTEEVLALADYSGISVARFSDRPDARVSRSAFYLHVVLTVFGETGCRREHRWSKRIAQKEKTPAGCSR